MVTSQSRLQNEDLLGKGKLYVVGIGPGLVEHLTVRAQKVLKDSDYVIGNGTYLDQIESLLNDQKVIRSTMGKEVDRARCAIELAGHSRVSIVSGGDANIYGMAGLVMEIAERTAMKVDIEVLPGVTAISAAASILGAPIVNDFAVISLSDLLTPWEVIEKRLIAASKADFVIALYNPKSRQRNSNFSKSIGILREHKNDSVPVGLVKNALRESGEDVIVTTLGEVLEYDDWVNMRTTVLIGNNESRIWKLDDIKRIITPRGYQRKYDY
ncbi:MAG: precorrin-3B C(17)-methyltransferase [Methanosarcinaceae archaeon]|nr:precorrin-3B C(17)-methyltransferase [Methanosarcinaceae archaeon]